VTVSWGTACFALPCAQGTERGPKNGSDNQCQESLFHHATFRGRPPFFAHFERVFLSYFFARAFPPRLASSRMSSPLSFAVIFIETMIILTGKFVNGKRARDSDEQALGRRPSVIRVSVTNDPFELLRSVHKVVKANGKENVPQYLHRDGIGPLAQVLRYLSEP